jgi:uncharacterized protein (DUF362 family)
MPLRIPSITLRNCADVGRGTNSIIGPSPSSQVVWLNPSSQAVNSVELCQDTASHVISVALVKVYPRLGAALTFGNYHGIAPATRYGTAKEGLDKLGEPAEIAVDLFSYHPADYALLGGSWGIEEGRSVHHNLIVAGASAVSVDAVAAAVMGFAPGDLEVLPMAEHRGFGSRDVDAIWVRGNEIEQARRPFRKPAGWTAPPHR